MKRDPAFPLHVYRCPICSLLFAFQGAPTDPWRFVCTVCVLSSVRSDLEHIPELCGPGAHLPTPPEIVATGLMSVDPEPPKCRKCHHGRVGLGYCDCALGRDLERVENLNL